jgi:hypothetical protein
MPEQELMIFDQLTIICTGCGDNRTVNLNPPLFGAAALIEWNKTQLTACHCGHPFCNIKARLANDRDQPSRN